MKLKFILAGVLLLVFVGAIVYTNNRIDNLEATIKQSNVEPQQTTKENKNTTQAEELTIEEQYAQFVQAKFEEYKNDKRFVYLKERNGVTFYSDIECTNKIDSPELLSCDVDSVVVNGKSVYVCMMKNGKLCYVKGDEHPSIWIEYGSPRFTANNKTK